MRFYKGRKIDYVLKWMVFMRVSVRGILIQDDQLLVIHRIKGDREYYVIPGGGVEDHETLIQALKRELLEEVGIQVDVLNEQPVYTYHDQDSIQYFYVVSYVSGEYGTGSGLEFKEQVNTNQYLLEFISFKDIKNICLVPEFLKEKLVKDFFK